MENQIFISVSDFCRAFAVGRTKFYEMCASGEVETAKVGRRRLVLFSSALDFAERCLQKQKNLESASSDSTLRDRLQPLLCNTHSRVDSSWEGPGECTESDPVTQTAVHVEPQIHSRQGVR